MNCLLMLILIPSLMIMAFAHDDSPQELTLSCLSVSDNARGPQGLPGKRGSKGEKGESCTPNFEADVVRNSWSEFQQNLSKQLDEVKEIKTSLFELQKNISDKIDKLEETCVSAVSQTDIEFIKANLTEIRGYVKSCLNTTVSTTSMSGPQLASPNLSPAFNITSRSIRNCDDVLRSGFRSDGIYSIFTGQQFVQVYCEFGSKRTDWMIFQQRLDGSVDFYLNWNSYVNGFGNKSGEFWLGLQALHEITSSRPYKLRVDLEDWRGNIAYAEYSSFFVGDSNSDFRLSVGEYCGTAGNSLSYQSGRAFSARDRDNDGTANSNCATSLQSGWWFHTCHRSNLNGQYLNVGPAGNRAGINWYSWKNSWYSMKKASMKMRPSD